jgi:hypothetical protein
MKLTIIISLQRSLRHYGSSWVYNSKARSIEPPSVAQTNPAVVQPGSLLPMSWLRSVHGSILNASYLVHVPTPKISPTVLAGSSYQSIR